MIVSLISVFGHRWREHTNKIYEQPVRNIFVYACFILVLFYLLMFAFYSLYVAVYVQSYSKQNRAHVANVLPVEIALRFWTISSECQCHHRRLKIYDIIICIEIVLLLWFLFLLLRTCAECLHCACCVAFRQSSSSVATIRDVIVSVRSVRRREAIDALELAAFHAKIMTETLTNWVGCDGWRRLAGGRRQCSKRLILLTVFPCNRKSEMAAKICSICPRCDSYTRCAHHTHPLALTSTSSNLWQIAVNILRFRIDQSKSRASNTC